MFVEAVSGHALLDEGACLREIFCCWDRNRTTARVSCLACHSPRSARFMLNEFAMPFLRR